MKAGTTLIAAAIVATFVAGASAAFVTSDVLPRASGDGIALKADEGVPQNLVTALKADEGVPQNRVIAMKADEGVPRNLVTA